MKYKRIYVFSIFFLLLSTAFYYSVQAKECGAGKRQLFFYAPDSIDNYTNKGLAERIYIQLRQPLEEIGYCINRFDASLPTDTALREELVMALLVRLLISERRVVRPATDEGSVVSDSVIILIADTSVCITVSLLKAGSWSRSELDHSAENPLLTLVYSPQEPTTFESVLMRKIVENMRMQYICHLRLESIPDGVKIRSSHGLEGTTPIEWIIPIGSIAISGELEGYKPIRRKIDLSVPGTHTYVFEMVKRRFYNSRFFIPTLALGTTSAACFVFERVFYDRYSRLGKEDRGRVPDPFERNFTIARNFERAAAATLSLGGLSLTLCFFFR